jgi:hypothetical protein
MFFSQLAARLDGSLEGSAMQAGHDEVKLHAE